MLTFSAEELKEDLVNKLVDVEAALTGTVELGRQVIRKHVKRVTLTPGEIEGKPVFHVTVEFELGGAGNSGVVLPSMLDASMQQYGFSTIAVTGLTLDTRRVRRKTSRSEATAGNDGEVPVSLTPTADAPVPVQL